MSVPGRVEAASLLLSLRPPPWFLRHARAVAEIAAWLAARASVGGVAVDRSLVESAALLHDIDKLLPRDDPAASLPHGSGSAAWLAGRGHPELADPVAWHPVTRLLDGPAFERWISAASLEERIVAYADKRAGQRLEPMADRFASWRRRYPETADGDRRDANVAGDGRDVPWSAASVRRVRSRAEALEADVCGTIGADPREIGRLRWTGPAIAAAAAKAAGRSSEARRGTAERRASGRETQRVSGSP